MADVSNRRNEFDHGYSHERQEEFTPEHHNSCPICMGE